MKSALMPICAALALGGCGLAAPVAPEPLERGVSWREIATDEDRERLRGWRDAWVQALAKARAAGHAADVASEGALLQPDVALPGAQPPEGQYRCRVIKIGAKSPGMLNYIIYPTFQCRVRAEEGVLSFAKLTGSQRPIGLLLPDNPRRMMFLGTLQLGDESMSLRYGRDRERDTVGVVERIGEQRWRLALPFPHFESTLDVIELIPAG
jgi:hypothetical protein